MALVQGGGPGLLGAVGPLLANDARIAQHLGGAAIRAIGDYFRAPRQYDTIRPLTSSSSSSKSNMPKRKASSQKKSTSSKKKKTSYKSNKKGKSAVRRRKVVRHHPYSKKGMRRDINKVIRMCHQQEAKLSYRFSSASTTYMYPGERRWNYHDLVKNHDLDNALAQCMVFDPASGILKKVDFGELAIQNTFTMRHRVSVRIRNNYQMPLDFKGWIVCPKTQTNTKPLDALEEGFQDRQIAGSQELGKSPLAGINDSTNFKKLWRTHSYRFVHLKPGEQTEISWSSPKFNFDPTQYQSQAADYYPKHHTAGFLHNICGVSGHEASTPGNPSLADGRIDYWWSVAIDIAYEGGGAFRTVYIDDFRGTQATHPEVTAKDFRQTDIAYPPAIPSNVSTTAPELPLGNLKE